MHFEGQVYIDGFFTTDAPLAAMLEADECEGVTEDSYFWVEYVFTSSLFVVSLYRLFVLLIYRFIFYSLRICQLLSLC